MAQRARVSSKERYSSKDEVKILSPSRLREGEYMVPWFSEPSFSTVRLYLDAMEVQVPESTYQINRMMAYSAATIIYMLVALSLIDRSILIPSFMD